MKSHIRIGYRDGEQMVSYPFAYDEEKTTLSVSFAHIVALISQIAADKPDLIKTTEDIFLCLYLGDAVDEFKDQLDKLKEEDVK